MFANERISFHAERNVHRFGAEKPLHQLPARASTETTVRTPIILVASCIVATVAAASSAAPPAGTPRVTEVIVLDVGTNMQKFSDLSSRVNAIATKYQNTGKTR